VQGAAWSDIAVAKNQGCRIQDAANPYITTGPKLFCQMGDARDFLFSTNILLSLLAMLSSKLAGDSTNCLA
jgi:hypothetical protein